MKKSLFFILTLILLSGCTNLQPTITNIRLCSEVPEDSEHCPDHTTSFSSDITKIHLSLTLQNIPDDSELRILWKYVDENNESIYFSTEKIIELYDSSFSDNEITTMIERDETTPWNIGNYEVIITGSADKLKSEVVLFEIK